jgi:predicted TIM-barrel fold metal-dependent hydrolase
VLDLDIIDAHHHLHDLAHSYPWLEDPAQPLRYHGDDTPLRRSYLLEDYRADVGDLKLVGSVHVENGAADAMGEVARIDRISATSGLPSVQVAKVSLLSPDAATVIDQLPNYTTVRGVRDILSWHPDPRYSHTDRADVITDPVWLENFDRLAEHGLSFDLQVFPEQLTRAAELAANHPKTTIILDHAGMPIGRDHASVNDWRKGMEELSRHPNVATKVSALGTNDHRWTDESIRVFVLETIRIFGPGRTMFGSNFPVDSLYSSFWALYAAFDRLTSDFTRAERQDMFAGNAARIYRMQTRLLRPQDGRSQAGDAGSIESDRLVRPPR